MARFVASSMELAPLLEELSCLNPNGDLLGTAEGGESGMREAMLGWHSSASFKAALQEHADEFTAFRHRQQEAALGQSAREETGGAGSGAPLFRLL